MREDDRDLYRRITPDVILGRDVRLAAFVNLYGCSVGDETRIGTFVEIQRGVTVGARCKIQSHSFLCTGVTLEDEVFIGHGVMFINDRDPYASRPDGRPQGEGDWELLPTLVRHRAAIGSGATILGGITIGEEALVGAGTVVTRDVPAGMVVVGNPARILGRRASIRQEAAAAPSAAGKDRQQYEPAEIR